MFGFRRRLRAKKPPPARIADKHAKSIPEKLSSVDAPVNFLQSRQLSLEYSFHTHISRYTGQTVTVFTCGGGLSGMGFTGVLLFANSIYIRLIAQPGPPPACSLGNSCLSFSGTPLGFISSNAGNLNLANRYLGTLGSVIDIPIGKIVSFVHNSI